MTLHRIIVHVICDLTRHTGQVDIVREQHDGAIGLRPENTNLGPGRTDLACSIDACELAAKA